MKNKIVDVRYIAPANAGGTNQMTDALMQGFVIAGKFKGQDEDVFILTLDEETYNARKAEKTAASGK